MAEKLAVFIFLVSGIAMAAEPRIQFKNDSTKEIGKDPKGCEIMAKRVGNTQVINYEFSSSDDHNTWVPSFQINQMTGELVGGIGSCNKQGTEMKNPAIYRTKKIGKYIIYSAKCGGAESAYDSVMQVAIDKTTGDIAYFYGDSKIAANTYEDGRFSGPKDPSKILICSTGVNDLKDKIAKSRDEIESVLKEEKGTNFISFDKAAGFVSKKPTGQTKGPGTR